tara:strand:- start:474 stop:662 length:189 start_codon:yes stop_codon:yes gene_type:complete
MEECNSPPKEEFPHDKHIYQTHEAGEECESDDNKKISHRAHFNKVYKRSSVIYNEDPAEVFR